jgi:hypothetical protein
MKKLLVLVLVLGMASMANAALTDILSDIELHLSGTTVTVIGLDVDHETSWLNAGIYTSTSNGIVSSPFNAYAAAGDLRQIFQWTGYNGVDIKSGQGLGDPLQTGAWFDFQYSGSAGDMFDIWAYEESTTTAAGQLELLPEPMTIALLGLGGLFLRRRK